MSLTIVVRNVIYLLLVIIALSAPSAMAGQDRGYDTNMLNAGMQLYLENCAVCHGEQAQSTVQDWYQRDASGKFPPPPLNGTAHTWHHSINSLMHTVRNGTIEIGGTMPAWKDKLDNEQIFSILIWLTSLWPDQVYEAWMEINEQSQ